MTKWILLVLLLAVVLLPLVGCNTVQGVGEDIQWVGRKTGEWIDPGPSHYEPISRY